MKKILLFLAAATIITSCSKLAENEFELTGTIDPSLNGKNAILQKQGGMQGLVSVDTVKIEEGKFIFKGKAESPSIHFVTVEGAPNVGLDFIMENGSIELKIEKDSLHNSKRSGTYNNEKLQEFISENFKIDKQAKDFQKKNTAAYMAAQASKDTTTMGKLTRELMSFEKKKTEYSEGFVEKNPKAYISVLLLKQQASMGTKPYAELKKLYDALDPELKKIKEGKELGEQLEKSKKVDESKASVEVGKTAPDFTALSPEGTPISLKQSLGKATIIDFWASWCGPCRKENPSVVAMYNELHAKGLNIIGVSLDKDAAKWKEAIAADKLTWNQISNLKHWEDPIAAQYAVQSIPATFLLDASGKIVARDLRGAELKAKVEELLAK